MARAVPTFLLIAGLALAGCGTAAPRGHDDGGGAGAGTGGVLAMDSLVVEHAPEPVDAGGPGPSSLSLLEAVRLTVQHDPRLQVALAKVRSARADASQARLWPNPILSVAVRFREGGGTPITDIGLAADLVAILQRPRKISAADNTLRAAVRGVITDVLDACAEAHEAYSAARAVDQELAALRERRARADRLLEMGRARLKVGEAARLAVTVLESERLAIDVEIDDKQAERTEARLALARLIGTPGGDIDWDLSTPHSIDPPRATEGQWLDAALRARPEVLAKQWELAALGDEAALSAWAPWEGGDAGAQAEYDAGWSVGPAVNTPLPLLDWGQARRAKARAARLQARHEMTELRRKVVEEVRSAVARYAASVDTLRKARDELLPLQQKRWEQSRASYEAGELDLAAMMLAEEDLSAARGTVIALEKKAASASIKLLRAAGGGGALEPRGDVRRQP
jgi:outer membrane protein, heavy metal efflux system